MSDWLTKFSKVNRVQAGTVPNYQVFKRRQDHKCSNQSEKALDSQKSANTPLQKAVLNECIALKTVLISSGISIVTLPL